MFETFIVQPIFNLLLFIYDFLPGNDFGVAIILFTIFIRFAMWPLLRKQLHQTRAMRKLQPQIKEIREKTKDDKQKQGEMLMELYREEGINPFGTIGLLFVQIPIFLGLFSALRAFINDPGRIIRLPYDFLRGNEHTQAMMQNVADQTTAALSEVPQETAELIENTYGLSGTVTIEQLELLTPIQQSELFTNLLTIKDAAGGVTEQLVTGPFFDQTLFGFIDLSTPGYSDAGFYLPVLIIAILAGVFQYLQTKQLTPQTEGKKPTIREKLKEAAEGKEPDQSELNAAVGNSMTKIFAPMIAIISATSPAGLAVYFATSGAVGYFQQRFLLNRDVEEMEEMQIETTKKKDDSPKPKKNKASSSTKSDESKSSTKKRTKNRKGVKTTVRVSSDNKKSKGS